MGRNSKTANWVSRVAFGALVSIMPVSAWAYDGPVFRALPALGLRLGDAGGLVVRSTQIEITSSELVATYDVENYRSTEVVSRVYAPVAPITFNLETNAAAFSGPLTENPLGVSVSVSGTQVPLTTKATASFLGVDITEQLAIGGLGLSPFSNDVGRDLETASDAFRAMTRENGWVTRHGGNWQLRVLPSFRQRFAPETRTWIEARAGWVVGKSVDTIMRMEDILVGIEGDPLSTLCLLPEQEREIRTLFSGFPTDEFVLPYTIQKGELVLADMVQDTHAISALKVRIAPDHPKDIVSVCGGEFTVQSDRSLMWEAAHAMPQTLAIYFISRVPEYRDD